MKLYELLEKNKESEYTIWDKDYDIEFYMEYGGKSDWDKAMRLIAKKLTVVEIKPNGVICDVSGLIERNIPNPIFDELFIDNDLDAIMDDFGAIMAGNVSEKWMMRFAECLDSTDTRTLPLEVDGMKIEELLKHFESADAIKNIKNLSLPEIQTIRVWLEMIIDCIE